MITTNGPTNLADVYGRQGVTFVNNSYVTGAAFYKISVWPGSSALSWESHKVFSEAMLTDALWHETDKLKRDTKKKPPRAPRTKAPRPQVAWPAQMQAFRSRTKSRRPAVQAL